MVREIVKKTVEMIGDEIGTAIDLGCGDGFDSIFLLENNWNVISIDLFTESIKKSVRKLDEKLQQNIIIKRQELENLDIPQANLIIANCSLPYCKIDKFDKTIKTIIDSVKTNGRFIGIFYGEDDYRKENNFITCFTKEELYNIFDKQFEIEYFKEVKMLNDFLKEEHLYEIIAKKIK